MKNSKIGIYNIKQRIKIQIKKVKKQDDLYVYEIKTTGGSYI